MTAQCRKRSGVCAIAAAVLGSLVCLASSGCGMTGQGEADALLPKLEPPPSFVSMANARGYTFRAGPGVVEEASASIPKELMVYRVVHAQPTREMICELAENVGVSVVPELRATLPETVEGSYRQVGLIGELTADIMAKESNVAPDDKYVSYVSKALGGIRGDNLVVLNMTVMDDGNFTLGLQGTGPDPEGEGPTDKEARAIAERFVERSGLLPEGCKLGGVSQSASTSGGPELGERVIGRQVVYQQYLEGYPAGQFVVQVNGKGEIYKVHRNVRNVTPLASYPIVTPEEAIEALGEGRGSITGPARPGAPLGVMIDKIKLCYDQAAPMVHFETMQPSYWIEGSVEGYTDGFHALVPAVRPEYLAEEEGTSKPVSGGGAGPESEREPK